MTSTRLTAAKKPIRKQSDEALSKSDIVTKFTQIRVNSMEFIGKEAIAIYFYDMTHHLESLKLESDLLEKKNRSHTNHINETALSQEFRMPLMIQLMFLESLLSSN